jgi:Raf kinase inhibitor-like YbhB/YbcL family protein
MQLTSTAFADGETIPSEYTCDGAGRAPDLVWSEIPTGVQSLALSCVDPDAPNGTFTHWTAWDLEPGAGGVVGGRVPEGAREGTTSFGDAGFGGPCPPPGHGVHHYHFRLSALRQSLGLDAGAPPETFAARLREAEVDHAELVGLYERR